MRAFTSALEQPGFAAVLWEILSAIKVAINTTIEKFLFRALQVDNDSIYAQLKAEQMGVL